eukprot:TRINITY_DN36715_c0_g1_i1.p1 TRINITY_DN36715_c0_g1~~TRINITY_DN36715_c0_g1_i1.p1  ORF type:complete len:239 (+),score=43.02 TRINITY_DN36715_c0_g1_i1:64-780(+)
MDDGSVADITTDVLRDALQKDQNGEHLAAAQGYLSYMDMIGKPDPKLLNRARLIVNTVADYNKGRGNLADELLVAGRELLKPMDMDPEACAKWMFICYGPTDGSNWGLKEAKTAAYVCNGQSITEEQWLQCPNGISCQDIYENYVNGFPFSFDIELSVNYLELGAAFDNPTKTARLLQERESILRSQETRRLNSERRFDSNGKRVSVAEVREVMKSLRKECRDVDALKRRCSEDFKFD